MSFIEEGKGSCMISLHRRTLSNKTHVWLHKKQEGKPSQTAENPSTGSWGETGFFPLKFLTWQNFRKHNFSEITKRRSKVREYSLKVKKKTHSKLRGFFMGCGVLGWILGLTKVGQARRATPVTPRKCGWNLRIFDSSCISGISCTWWSLHGARPGRPCRPHPPHSWGA